MQDRKQRGVDDQRLGIADQLGQDSAPQGLQKPPEVADAPVQRGGMEAEDSGKQVREEAGELAQEGAFALHPSKLLEEGQGHDLRIGELFEGLVAPPFGVDPVIDVVYLAEKHGQGLFQEGERWGKLGWGHLKLLWEGNSDGPRFTLQTTQQTSRPSSSALSRVIRATIWLSPTRSVTLAATSPFTTSVMMPGSRLRVLSFIFQTPFFTVD